MIEALSWEDGMQDDGIALYRRFLQGDERGLEELISLYQRGLLRFIYGYVHDVFLAEDILTDVFLALYYKRSFRETDNATLKTYLYTIARNKSLNALKKRTRRKEISLDALTETGADGQEEVLRFLYYNDSPQTSLERAERIKILRDALPKIRKDYREVLSLRFFEDLSPEEIAKITRRPIKQVYNLLTRGKNALKQQLLSEGIHYEDL